MKNKIKIIDNFYIEEHEVDVHLVGLEDDIKKIDESKIADFIEQEKNKTIKFANGSEEKKGYCSSWTIFYFFEENWPVKVLKVDVNDGEPWYYYSY